MLLIVAIFSGLWYTGCNSYEEMLSNLKSHEKVKFKKYDQKDVTCFQYLLLRKDDDKMIGAVNVRPYPTIHLDVSETYCGNIGYSIRPSERSKGYAKIALELAIEKCRAINTNLTDVIVCCYRDNIASKKVILSCGGELIEDVDAVIPYQRFKIVKKV